MKTIEDSNKHLGIVEYDELQHESMKHKLKCEYMPRL